MNKGKNMILPIIASVGVGVATYYSMRQNSNKDPVQQMTKMLNNQ